VKNKGEDLEALSHKL